MSRYLSLDIDPDMNISQSIQVKLEDKGVVIEVETYGGYCEDEDRDEGEPTINTTYKTYAEMGIEVKDVEDE